MKKIAVIMFIASLLAAGCACKEKKTFSDQPAMTNVIQSADFNQEHYIWEQFLFPTNRTTGR